MKREVKEKLSHGLIYEGEITSFNLKFIKTILTYVTDSSLMELCRAKCKLKTP